MPNLGPIAATIQADGSATLELDGRTETIATTRSEDARREIVHRAAQRAASLGSPVPVTVTEPDGSARLMVAADGAVTDAEEVDAATRTPASEPSAVAPSNDAGAAAASSETGTAAPTNEPIPPATVAEVFSQAGGGDPAVALAQGEPKNAQDAADEPAASPEPAPQATRPAAAERPSFLKQEQVEQPATTGWRGAFARMGVRVAPSARERAERADLHAVSQHWAGPRTIAVVNGKGGAGKTPTTINLAAVFARNGGAGVLAWDNNQTRGTLGWRTERGPHEATLLDLLPQTARLLGTGAQSADLARFVHHQTADKFDVLRSKPAVLASQQRITAADVSSIHAVAAKYYRLIVIDSGNDETDPLWLQMIDHTDQLVIATTTRDDHAEAGALLLEALAERDERSARLAQNAVAVVTQADPKATDADIRHVAHGFGALAREVVSIPFDPTLVDGIITFDALRADTQRAWLAAAAAIARGL
ncbi:ATPase [Microbacterium protaetiae]|uniref:ATPase n=1 Tax=Microbacterium protaetiae TaxID=2509458 RepID=A0A4P6ECA8_9MICO|nr:AAA family ATPase [Microbacterium protaetiae]QAY59664.1 ATPase [Microbacterium protaetiae]